ncbi:MAG TPA: hypothetical protein VMW91_06595 [Desulfosporosinus sp.]|nr:hypothetical protein [Desulfosporosinus sp.]
MPRTRTGRSRLEHRHGWLDAVWQGATRTCRKPRGLRFSRSMKGTLTQDVSSASSTKDGDRRGEQWNVCERAKTLPP